MPSEIDRATPKALPLDAEATIVPHGGSGFSSTFRLTSTLEDGEAQLLFVKTGRRDSGVIFAVGQPDLCEHASLLAIHTADPTLCPRTDAHGPLSQIQGFFLTTSFLSPPPSADSSSAAPIPDGCEVALRGLPLPTCCEQGRDSELHDLVNVTIDRVVPRLLSRGLLPSPNGSPAQPALVHGDLECPATISVCRYSQEQRPPPRPPRDVPRRLGRECAGAGAQGGAGERGSGALWRCRRRRMVQTHERPRGERRRRTSASEVRVHGE
ncbi:unnamed protein product [Diplocarpon coronariae]